MRVPARPDVESLILENRWPELRSELGSWPAPEAAELIQQIEDDHRVRLYNLLPRRLRYEVFSHLNHETQQWIWARQTDEEVRQLLHSLEPDDRTHLLEQLPEESRERSLGLLNPIEAYAARQLLSYPEESIGRLMSPQFVAVRPTWTIDHALRHIRAQKPDPNTITNIYVTDAEGKLLDMVELPKLVVAEPQQKVEDIMDGVYVALSPEDDRESAVQLMLKYDAVALPVTGAGGVLLGVVTVDDVLDVAEEEATEDFQKQAAVAPLKGSYLEAGIWPLFRKRIPWLAVLLLVYVGASGVISAFEDTLSAEIILASFIPLLMGSGGNVGAQSGTLAVRAIATGELRGSLWLRALTKELAVGVTIGLTLGALAAIIGQIRGGSQIALVVAGAMVLIVIAANIFGIMLPLLLARIGVDPAVAGSPLITSFADVTSLLIYFTLATLLLGL